MSNIATIEPRLSVTVAMATKFEMDPRRFEQTLRATVFPSSGTPEQFAAFLLVARQYDLNPITKEIYAFPSRNGIVPIVSIDGWLKLINSHPQFDGMEFEDNHDDGGELVSVTCRLWRKDRTRPIVVTEYLSECYRATDAWKMKHRMLRHKTLIQGARYAFGFAGVYDPDEGERIVIAQDGGVSQAAAPRTLPTPPAPPSAPQAAIAPPKREAAPAPPHGQQEAFDFDAFRAALQAAPETIEAKSAVFDEWIKPRDGTMSAEDLEEAQNVLNEICAPLWEAGR